MPQPENAGPEDYNALRIRVHTLKQQHVEAVQQQHVHREVDVASIASRCAHIEALNGALSADNEKLQQQLRQNTERAAKLRRQQEREHQKLREQVEKLSAAASTVDENWAAKLEASESTTVMRVEQLEAEIARLKHEQDAKVAQLQRDQDANLQDIDEWCRGEIEAVQHNARVQVAQAHGAVEQWQQKYDDISGSRRQLAETNQRLLQELNELRAALQARDGDLERANAALLRLHRQHADEQAAYDEEKRALQQQLAEQLESKRAQHAEQLAHIEGRLQAVVAKKDATIAALRGELQSTYAALLPLKSM